MEEWKIKAIAMQDQFSNLFGYFDYDFYNYDGLEYLERKLTFMLYGKSVEDDKKNRASINKLKEVIGFENQYKENGEKGILMSFIFLCIKGDNDIYLEPVFKVPKDKELSSSTFIDKHARVYESWDYFLNTNILPKCDYCYPVNGKYQVDKNGEVQVEFRKSPAASTEAKVLNVLDCTSTGVAGASTVLAVASLFVPITTPILVANMVAGAAVGTYSTVRSSVALHDRRKHKQTIGLKDTESRNCWLSIAGNTAGVLAVSATAVASKMAQVGNVVGKAGCATVNAFNVGNVTINGLGILNNVFVLKEKYQNDSLTTSDILHFSTSVLLFAHAAVNMKTAETIIKETQQNVIDDYSASFVGKKQRKLFRNIKRKAGYDTVDGNAKIIRTLRHIKNKKDFSSVLGIEINEESSVNRGGNLISRLVFNVIGSMSTLCINEMINLLSKFPTVLHEGIVKFAKEIFGALGWKNDEQFLEVLYVLCGYVYSKGKDIVGYTCTKKKYVDENESNTFVYRCQTILNDLPTEIMKKFLKTATRCANILIKKIPSFENLYKDLLFKVANICDKLSLFDHFNSVERIIDIALLLCKNMEWTEADYVVQVIKLLCFYIKSTIKHIQDEAMLLGQPVQQGLGNSTPNENASVYSSSCLKILESIENNTESHPLLLEGINNIDSNNAMSQSDYLVTKYTCENPLTKKVNFRNRENLQLSQNEIYDICEEISGCLIDYTNCTVKHEGQNIFVDMWDKRIMIICNIDDGFVTGYVTTDYS